jgi:hypothetical protein
MLVSEPPECLPLTMVGCPSGSGRVGWHAMVAGTLCSIVLEGGRIELWGKESLVVCTP